jgi:hypothetical protein
MFIVVDLFSPPAIPARRESSPRMFNFVNLLTVKTTNLLPLWCVGPENQAAAAQPGP